MVKLTKASLTASIKVSSDRARRCLASSVVVVQIKLHTLLDNCNIIEIQCTMAFHTSQMFINSHNWSVNVIRPPDKSV